MRRSIFIVGIIAAFVLAPATGLSSGSTVSAAPDAKACWGQASQVFAQMGAMGEHSSSFPTPRAGLRNLARLLSDAGVIPDDSMQALGAFVAAELGLEIESCS